MKNPDNSPAIAFLFPGQGSQALKMGHDLANTYPAACQVYEQADDQLGFSLSRLCWQGPEDELNDTINTQPALLTHSVAVLQVLEEIFPKIRPAFTAGHSMGELSALVASGALTFEQSLLLSRRRGELMKEAGEVTPGGMAAILGGELSKVEQICAEASRQDEIVQVANDNCPGQVVISGANPALDRAVELAQKAGIRKIRRLAVSIGAHSPLMIHAQERFFQAVAEAPFTNPHTPLIGNVNAKPLTTIEAIRADLQAQLTSRVRWTETIQEIVRSGVSITLELGSGSVLTNLQKRIDENLIGYAIGEPADIEKLKAI